MNTPFGLIRRSDNKIKFKMLLLKLADYYKTSKYNANSTYQKDSVYSTFPITIFDHTLNVMPNDSCEKC